MHLQLNLATISIDLAKLIDPGIVDVAIARLLAAFEAIGLSRAPRSFEG